MFRFVVFSIFSTFVVNGFDAGLGLHHIRHINKRVRIVGGDIANIEDYPYQVSLEYYGDHQCGGAILNETFIITAAHCTYSINAGAFKVRAGTSSLEKGGQLIPVMEKFEHPKFNHLTYDYDICLLRLKKPIEFNSKAKPVKIPAENQFFSIGSHASVTGWGSLSSKSSANSKELRVVSVPITNTAPCVEAYEKIVPITTRMLCAGESGKDACHGDSGGPFVQNNTLVGIVSLGSGCGRPGFPGVYTNVSAVQNFVKEFR